MCVLGSHGLFVFGRRRVSRRGIPIRPDVARPQPEQSFVGPDLLQESFVMPVLFGWYLELGDMAYFVVAIAKTIHFGMKAGAHIFAARPV